MPNKEKKYKCDYCRKKFKTELFLKKHIKVLHNQGGKNYDCVECGKDFGTAPILRKHIEFVHEGRSDYNCAQCGKNFRTAHALKTHIECVHEGRRDYNCTECGKNFGTSQVLKQHIECVHEGRRDYNCAECGKSFSTAQYVKVHIKCVHEGRRDYNCTKCSKKFSDSSKLKKHIECLHEKGKDHNCTKCSKKFSQSINLKRHIEHFHEKRKASKQVSETAVDEENSEIVQETNKVRIPGISNAANNDTCEHMKVKKEQLDTEEMPTFESESTYFDEKIKKEIKIEPLESIHDGQMFKDPDIRRKSKQGENNSNSQISLIHYEKSKEQNENMVQSIKIKKEEIEFEEMPIFEKDSAYLDETIKKEIKTEPYH